MLQLVDPFGRKVDYLRLSVTNRCNLKCFYCRPDLNCCPDPAEGPELSLEEITAICRAAVKLGIKKVRLTGGEPLVRKDIIDIINRISEFPEVVDLSLTTNGVLLVKKAESLAKAGLDRVNISLDSLQSLTFNRITGGVLAPVLEGIKKAVSVGLTPVKLNIVLLKGINDSEVADFLRLTKDHPLEVRFIEYMPVGGSQEQWKKYFVPLSRVEEIAAAEGQTEAVANSFGSGPARYFKFSGAAGKVGLISPLSRHFCRHCNRLRVTSDAKIKPCLFTSDEIDLRSVMNNPKELEQAFLKATAIKPPPEDTSEDAGLRAKQWQGSRKMFQIGG